MILAKWHKKPTYECPYLRITKMYGDDKRLSQEESEIMKLKLLKELEKLLKVK